MNTIFNKILDASRIEFARYKIVLTTHENVVVTETKGYKNTIFIGSKSDFVAWVSSKTTEEETEELCNQYDNNVNYNF